MVAAAAVLFLDLDYLIPSDTLGFQVPYPGRYRVTLEAYAYQADTPVILTLLQGKRPGRLVQLTDLVDVFDLVGTTPRTVETTAYLRPGELLNTGVLDLDRRDFRNCRFGYVKNCEDEGVALKSMTIEGPLLELWPPASTRQL